MAAQSETPFNSLSEGNQWIRCFHSLLNWTNQLPFQHRFRSGHTEFHVIMCAHSHFVDLCALLLNDSKFDKDTNVLPPFDSMQSQVISIFHSVCLEWNRCEPDIRLRVKKKYTHERMCNRSVNVKKSYVVNGEVLLLLTLSNEKKKKTDSCLPFVIAHHTRFEQTRIVFAMVCLMFLTSNLAWICWCDALFSDSLCHLHGKCL